MCKSSRDSQAPGFAEVKKRVIAWLLYEGHQPLSTQLYSVVLSPGTVAMCRLQSLYNHSKRYMDTRMYLTAFIALMVWLIC